MCDPSSLSLHVAAHVLLFCGMVSTWISWRIEVRAHRKTRRALDWWREHGRSAPKAVPPKPGGAA